MDIWHELRIEPTKDRRAIKRAYSVRLKDVHPEDDPEGFQRLRDAYERAIDYLDGPRRVEPMLEPESPISVPPPEPSISHVPFRARAITHQRANRKKRSPIVPTRARRSRLPERVVEPPKKRPELERFRRDFLNNDWSDKRRRMVGLLLLPYELDVLDQEYDRLPAREQLHWHEEFEALLEELMLEYGVDLEELGINSATADYWTTAPESGQTKGLWWGSAIVSAAAAIVVMLVISGLRPADEMSYGPYLWWAETVWLFGVIATASRTWLSHRRHFWGLVCATLLSQPVIPELIGVNFWLGAITLVAATSFARASTYVIISMAAQLSVLPVFGLIPVMWFGEAVRWVLRVPPERDIGHGLRGALGPVLAWVVVFSAFAGSIHGTLEAWTRVLFAAVWLLCAEGFMAYVRSDGVTVR